MQGGAPYPLHEFVDTWHNKYVKKKITRGLPSHDTHKKKAIVPRENGRIKRIYY